MLLRAHIGSEKTACENSVPFPTYSVRGLVHSGVFGVLSPVAVFWQMAAVLSNVKTCLKQGNVITDFFGLRPPTIARYLALE